MVNFVNDLRIILKSVHSDLRISSESKKYLNDLTYSMVKRLLQIIDYENIQSSFEKVLGGMFQSARNICIDKNSRWKFTIKENVISDISKNYGKNLNNDSIIMLRCFVEYILKA